MHVARKPTPAPADLDRLTERLRALLGEESANAWEIGRALEEVAGGSYRARHASFDAYVRVELGYSRARAYALRRVARQFTREQVVEHGWTRLELVLAIWEIQPGVEDPARVAEYEFPTAEGPRRLAGLSHDDLEDVLAALRDRRDRNDAGSLPRAARSLVAHVRRGMKRVRGFRMYASVPRARSGVEDARFAILGAPVREASAIGGLLVLGARHAGLVRAGRKPAGRKPAGRKRAGRKRK